LTRLAEINAHVRERYLDAELVEPVLYPPPELSADVPLLERARLDHAFYDHLRGAEAVHAEHLHPFQYERAEILVPGNLLPDLLHNLYHVVDVLLVRDAHVDDVA